MTYIIFGVLGIIALLLIIAVIRTLSIKAPAIGECKTKISEEEIETAAKKLPSINGIVTNASIGIPFKTAIRIRPFLRPFIILNDCDIIAQTPACIFLAATKGTAAIPSVAHIHIPTESKAIDTQCIP